MFCDPALAAVDPLGERLFLAVPAQAGLRQGRGGGVVFVETFPAGAFSLAAHRLHEQPRCPVAHAAREVLLPCAVIQLLAGDVGAVGEQPVPSAPCSVLRCPASRRCNSASLVVVCLAVLERCQSQAPGWWVPSGWKQSGEPARCCRSRCRCTLRSRALSNRSDPPTAAPSLPTSDHCARPPPRSCWGRGRTTPAHRRPGDAAADARP